jgi:hypothetical protein
MKTGSPALALFALLALAACHSQPTAGGLTADEERELDNAAAMLDQQNIFDTSSDSLTNEAEIAGPENGSGAGTGNRSGNAQ